MILGELMLPCGYMPPMIRALSVARSGTCLLSVQPIALSVQPIAATTFLTVAVLHTIAHRQ